MTTHNTETEMDDLHYDTERNDRLREDAWFNCAKCGKEVRESEWISLCNDCGDALEEADARRAESSTEQS